MKSPWGHDSSHWETAQVSKDRARRVRGLCVQHKTVMASVLKHWKPNVATALLISPSVHILANQGWGGRVSFLISTLFWTGTILTGKEAKHSLPAPLSHPPLALPPPFSLPGSWTTRGKSSRCGGSGEHLGFITWYVRRVWNVSSDSNS